MQPSTAPALKTPSLQSVPRKLLPAPAWCCLALAYLGYFGLLGSLQPLLAPILLERGFAAQRVGLILASLSLLTGAMPLLVAALAARTGWGRVRTFRLFAVATLLISQALYWRANLGPAAQYVLLLALLTAAHAPLNAVLDAAALEMCARHGWAFGRLRMMGSVGFIVTATALGSTVPKEGIGHVVHAAVAALAAVVAASALFLPRAPRKKAMSAGLRSELSAPVLSPWAVYLLVGALALHSASFGPFQYGFTLLGRSLMLSPLAVAAAWSLGVVTEILAFGLCAPLLRRYGWRRVLAASLLAAPVRWLALGLWPSTATYFLVQLLHGPSFALFYAAGMAGLNNASTTRRATQAQTCFCALVAGLAPGPALYGAGLAHAHLPLPYIFLGAASLNALALGLFAAANKLPLQPSMRAQPRARRSRMASRRLACAASRYAVTGR